MRNFTSEPSFKNFPLTQVNCIQPHNCDDNLVSTMSGVPTMRLFVLLENACHDLDLRAHMQSSDEFELSYKRCTERSLRSKGWGTPVKKQPPVTGTAVNYHTVSSSSSPLLLHAVTDITNTRTRIREIVCCLQLQCFIPSILILFYSKRRYLVLEKEFHKEEGPFVKGLDKALASFHVQRQAY